MSAPTYWVRIVTRATATEPSETVILPGFYDSREEAQEAFEVMLHTWPNYFYGCELHIEEKAAQ